MDAIYIIKVYGSIEASYRNPHYASDQFILMELCRHLSYLHEKAWCKKWDTTCKLPISIRGVLIHLLEISQNNENRFGILQIDSREDSRIL